MTQATQTELATGELLLAGIIQGEDFASFIQAYNSNIPHNTSLDTPTLMLLEEQPRRVIQQHARQDLLHFAFFDPTFDFTPYTSGRIFHALGELRWERQDTNIQVVYTGSRKYKPYSQRQRIFPVREKAGAATARSYRFGSASRRFRRGSYSAPVALPAVTYAGRRGTSTSGHMRIYRPRYGTELRLSFQKPCTFPEAIRVNRSK